jgi:hypothetical protein
LKLHTLCGAVACLLSCSASYADSIVLNLSVTDPVQTVLPGSILTFHGTLTNSISTDLPIATYALIGGLGVLDFSEQLTPETVPGNGQISGILVSFLVGDNASSQTFGMNAVSSLHDPVSGNSYASNFVSTEVTIVPEPSNVGVICIGIAVSLVLIVRKGRQALVV